MQEYMIKAEKVIIGDGTVVDDASLLIRGEMIADIGINIPTTPDTMILDFSEHLLSPSSFLGSFIFGVLSTVIIWLYVGNEDKTARD